MCCLCLVTEIPKKCSGTVGVVHLNLHTHSGGLTESSSRSHALPGMGQPVPCAVLVYKLSTHIRVWKYWNCTYKASNSGVAVFNSENRSVSYSEAVYQFCPGGYFNFQIK